MANYDKLSEKDAFAAERAARAAKYIKTGAGVNQGDQKAQSAAEFDAAAKKEAGKMSAAGKAKAAELRDQAKKLRGE